MTERDEETVIIPADVDLSEAEKEKIRSQLETKAADTIEGTRAQIVFAKEQVVHKITPKEETGKAKEVPVPVEKMKIKSA
jgi:hypothetical protein